MTREAMEILDHLADVHGVSLGEGGPNPLPLTENNLRFAHRWYERNEGCKLP